MAKTSDPATRLREAGLRVTPQRRAILLAFTGDRAEHLTAEQIFERVREHLPTVSRATIYSTVADFARGGLLAPVGRPEPVRYESNVEPHDHFLCTRCGRRFDIELEGTADSPAPEAIEGFAVERRVLTLEGSCRPCLDFASGLHRAVADRRRPAAARDLAELIARTEGVSVGAMDSPIGRLHVACSGAGLMRVVFSEHADRGVLEPLVTAGGAATARTQLAEYFSGARSEFDLAVDRAAVADRDAGVLEQTEHVPYGQTRAYHELGGAPPRSVGRALGANPVPIVVPCHRLGRAIGDPVDYTGGIERKRALVAMESGFARAAV